MLQTAKQGIYRAFDVAERLCSGKHFPDTILPPLSQNTTEGTFEAPSIFFNVFQRFFKAQCPPFLELIRQSDFGGMQNVLLKGALPFRIVFRCGYF